MGTAGNTVPVTDHLRARIEATNDPRRDAVRLPRPVRLTISVRMCEAIRTGVGVDQEAHGYAGPVGKKGFGAAIAPHMTPHMLSTERSFWLMSANSEVTETESHQGKQSCVVTEHHGAELLCRS